MRNQSQGCRSANEVPFSMPQTFPAIDLEKLISLVETHRQEHAHLVKGVRKCTQILSEACNTIERSFSGSWFGWHSKMYFGDFEEPSLQDQFSVEWGGANGIPSGWFQRRQEEVEKRIEELAKLNLADLTQQNTKLADCMKDLQDNLTPYLAPIRASHSLASESKTLEKLEDFKWDESAFFESLRLAQSSAPNTSRDSQAVMQGFWQPAFEGPAALAHSGKRKTIDAEEFWSLALRLLRQLQALALAENAYSKASSEPLRYCLEYLQKIPFSCC
jgi:hypothetical protein